MVRKIGFGGGKTRPQKVQERLPKTTNGQEPLRRNRRSVMRIVLFVLVMVVMEGVGFSLIFQSINDGKVVGFIAGSIFSLVVAAMAARVVMRYNSGGRATRPSQNHTWRYENDDSGNKP